MGRSQITKRYEITDEIRELQKLAIDAQNSSGCEVNIDITQDLVTINGFRKMTRVEAKSYLLELLNPDNPNLIPLMHPIGNIIQNHLFTKHLGNMLYIQNIHKLKPLS